MRAKRPSRLVIMLGAVAAPLFAAAAALAAANGPGAIRLADNVVPAPFGYETLAIHYVAAESTPLYISPFLYPGTVSNAKLMPGEAVDVLAKAKDYDWVLVGKNGVGIGYVPISRLNKRGP